MITSDQLAARAARAGSHYFDRATMRFFSSRVHDVWELSAVRVLFITSERDEGGLLYGPQPRAYSLRLATFTPDDDGRRERVDIGDAPGATFQEHATLAAARKAARAWILDDGGAVLPVVAPSLLTPAERKAWDDALAGKTLWRQGGGRYRDVHPSAEHRVDVLDRLTAWGALREVPAGGGVIRSWVRA